MENQFKVGDKVYSLAHGWGDVINILTGTDSETPMNVKFLYDSDWFTIDGRLYSETPICLFHYEPEITRPEWKPKEGEWCWFYDVLTNDGVNLRRFSSMVGDRYLTKCGVEWNFCAPFTGELPEHLK